MRPFPQSGSKYFLVQRLTLYSLLAGAALCNSGCANVASIPSPPSGPQGISVTVTPSSGSVMLGNQFLFTAAVKNSSDNAVTWSVNGVAGGGAQTGTITSGGVYTAPGDLPIPANLTVTATSVYAGAANGFTLKVIGTGFTASASGTGSVLLIGGTARTTTCRTAQECIAPVTAADVALAGNVSVQGQNPGGALSNAVSLVVAVPNASDDVMSLSAGAPEVSGKDIVVVEPTTAGVSVPGNDGDLDVAALGIFSAVNNSCTLGGNPVMLTPPQSGVATADVCLFSQSGLDASMTYTVTGPGDVAVIAKQPLGLGIIRLTLQLPATAAPSARTLFIQNTNLDKTAATGTLWVQ
jgi:hypothetical protein